MATFQLNTNVTRNGAQLQSVATTTTQESVYEYDNATHPIGTNVELVPAVTVDFSECKLVYIYSSTACTIKTEDSGSPEQTFSVPAGGYIAWDASSAQSCPFTTDFTGLYVTNAAETDLYILIVHTQG